MKIVKKEDSVKIKIDKFTTAYEYDMHDKDINGAVVHITGRTPEKGFIMNEVSKEMAYVIKGSGKIIVEDKEFVLNKGDVVLINTGEKYYWDANMTVFVPCTPSWYPEQSKAVS